MGNYSQIGLEEINQILKHYEVGIGEEFWATLEGTSNSNYKVKLNTGKNILLKISNDKTIDQLNNEQSILQVLEKYEYKYSIHPLKTIHGKAIYEHEGHYGVVFPFVDGLPPVIDKDICVQLGRALASLHSLEIHTEDLDSIRPYSLVGYGGESISDYVKTQEAPRDFVGAFKEMFPDGLDKIPYDTFPVGIIHGDLYFDNSLFKDKAISTLIDFEQAGRGRFILDLGIAISGSCLNEQRTNIDKDLMESFLAGYQDIRPLIRIEKEHLKVAVLVGFFSIGLWRIKRFYEGNLDPQKKFNYRELLFRAKLFNDFFPETILEL